jgi:guanine nucleotide-binding protein subunit gamma
MSSAAPAAQYEMRGSGDGRSKKQIMAELKLRRLQELNVRLREDLERRRIPVSQAAAE